MTKPQIKLELAGRFLRFEAVNEQTGERRLLAGESPNLILNQGLNRLGHLGSATAILQAVQVGTGSTPPTVTDSSLANYLNGTSTNQGGFSEYIAGPPAYVRTVVTRRFPAGAAAGNLSEVGIGWSSSTGSLFSRALIKDGSGNPTTITVLPAEALDVTYELRLYIPGDVTGSITDAASGVTHDYIIRPQNVSSTLYWDAGLWSSGTAAVGHQLGSYSWAYNGTIGTATASPSGSSYGSSSITTLSTAAYSNNSYKLVMTMGFGLNEGNLSGGIRSISLPNKITAWQVQFTPAIAKTGTKTLSLTFEFSWARRP